MSNSVREASMATKSSKNADLESLENLEQKVQLLIETIESIRNENSLLKTENQRLTQDLDSTHSRLTQTEGEKAEINSLKDERELVRARVAEMLGQLETLNL